MVGSMSVAQATTLGVISPINAWSSPDVMPPLSQKSSLPQQGVRRIR